MNLALMIVCLGLAALFLWAALRPDTWSWHRGRLIGGAACLVALSILCGYFHFREVKSPSELEEIIPIYPEYTGVKWVPQVAEERYWLMESPDALEAVVAFYEGVAAESGWELERSGEGRMAMLDLTRGTTRVFLTITREGEGSKLAYSVTDIEGE